MFAGDVFEPRRNDDRFHPALFCKEKAMTDNTAIDKPKKMSEATRQERAIIIAARIAIAIMTSAMCTAAQIARAIDQAAADPEDAADLDGVPAGPEALDWPELDDTGVCYGCN
jgi:uncharacterized iron-regulated protein